jgi:hypothetical protein
MAYSPDNPTWDPEALIYGSKVYDTPAPTPSYTNNNDDYSPAPVSKPAPVSAPAKSPTTSKAYNQYGGYSTADEYAAAIKRVISSGGNFQRPDEANMFMANNPQYNWSGKATPVQTPAPVQAPIPITPDGLTGAIGAEIQKPFDYTQDPQYLEWIAQAKVQAQKVNDLMKLLETEISTPYDPANDPQYNILLELAKQNAGKAGQQTMEELNARGILNSTITGDRTAEIQQDYMTQATQQATQNAQIAKQEKINNILSQLGIQTRQEETSYGRGMEAGQMGSDANQDRMSNITGLLDTLREKELTDKKIQIEEQQRTLDNAWNRVQSLGYVDNQASVALGIPVGTPSFEAKKYYQDRKDRLAEQATDNARQWESIKQSKADQSLGVLMDIWQKTGTAPAGIPGVPQGTPLYNKNGASNMQEERAGLVEAIRSGQLTPQQALQRIEEDTRLGFYTPEEAQQLTSDLTVIAKNAPQAPVKEDTKTTSPSVETLKKQWFTDPTGKEAGTAQMDWVSWNRDTTRGRSAGVSYNEWKSLYGPSLSSGN